MDSLIATATRALATGGPFGALDRVALRGDATVLALHDITMVQLGDLARAKLLLRCTARAFGAREAVVRAHCIVAEAEVVLVSRNFGWPAKALHTAYATLETHDDHVNAIHARCLSIYHLLLIGRLDDVEAAFAVLTPAPLPPALQAVHTLVIAGIAIRRLQTGAARAALSDTERAVRQAGIPTLTAEAERTTLALNASAARLISRGEEHVLHLDDAETLFASDALVVGTCQLTTQQTDVIVPLVARPMLFTLARALAGARPKDEAWDAFIARASHTRHPDESHRVWLHAEIGRLRITLDTLGMTKTTRRGFTLQPHTAQAVVVLAQPVAEQYAAVLACFADGESWSSSALTFTLGASQRTVQRALDALAAAGKVQSFGRGYARRWVAPPLPEFVTTLLLSAPPPSD